jgi:hypothetical protein
LGRFDGRALVVATVGPVPLTVDVLGGRVLDEAPISVLASDAVGAAVVAPDIVVVPAASVEEVVVRALGPQPAIIKLTSSARAIRTMMAGRAFRAGPSTFPAYRIPRRRALAKHQSISSRLRLCTCETVSYI